jgi:HAD superfamily hydrolase (TIGR01509 family)
MSGIQHRPVALVFDLDGVLVDSAPCHRRAFEEVFRPFRIPDFDYRRYAGWKTANVVENVLRRSGREPAPQLIADLSTEKSRLARKELRETNPVVPDCIPILEQLAQGYRLGLASSGSRASVDLFLSVNGCARLFRSVLCGDDVNAAKPDPEIYRRTFEALQVDPRDAVVVEDATAGIQAALAAGTGTVIGVEGTCPAAQLKAAGAGTVIHGISDLPALLAETYESAVPTGN